MVNLFNDLIIMVVVFDVMVGYLFVKGMRRLIIIRRND